MLGWYFVCLILFLMLGWYLVFFIGFGDFYCFYLEIIGDVIYIIVWNNDIIVFGIIYRLICLVRSGYFYLYG